MAKFSKRNFKLIIKEIENMEAADQNIDVPIGILEIMYDDYAGIIDKYFDSGYKRDVDKLWDDLHTKYFNIQLDSNSITTNKLNPTDDPYKFYTMV